MSVSRDAVLAELGIPVWRARRGVTFPGGPAVVAEQAPSLDVPHAMPVGADAVAAEQPLAQPLAVDICLYADAHHAAETALLERIVEAVCGLRAGLRVATVGLDAPSIPAHVAVRLDGRSLPSLTAMAADPALKRPVWQALKDAVARLS